MVYDLLDVFLELYEKNGDKVILDHYLLKDGLYVKIDDGGNLEYYIFKNDKKEKKKELCFKDLEKRNSRDMYSWFVERDYYSIYLNSNKSFLDKKIHNINYFTLFVKLESFISKDSVKLLAPDAISNQFNALKNYSKFTKPQEVAILKMKKEQLENPERIADIEKKQITLETKLPEIIEVAKENGIDNYIKLFFDASVEKYQEESKYYYDIKIFNDIAYSKKINDLVFGLSDSNMGLNAKKPYLEHKSRKIEVPFMISNSNALLIRKFFDWLKYQKYQDKNPLGYTGEEGEAIFLDRDFREKDVVTEFDYIPIKIAELKEPVIVKNYLHISKDKVPMEDREIKELYQLEEIVDTVFYNKQLANNYYGEVYNKLDKSLASLIYMTRDAMRNYFKKYDSGAFYHVVERYGTEFVIDHLKNNRENKALESLNLKLSLMYYINKGEAVDIVAMQNRMIEKLDTSDYESLKRDEFYYLSGQVVRYMLSLSKSGKKNADMLESYLRAKNFGKLLEEIRFTFKKYSHEISLKHTRFDNAYALVNAYEEDVSSKIDVDAFLVGALTQNIFYIKKEKEA